MVRKLLCMLPNASENIDGIAFEPYEGGGMISVDPIDAIDESLVRKFLRINGYKIVEVRANEAAAVSQKRQATRRRVKDEVVNG